MGPIHHFTCALELHLYTLRRRIRREAICSDHGCRQIDRRVLPPGHYSEFLYDLREPVEQATSL